MERSYMHILVQVLIILSCAFLTPLAHADEITDTIDKSINYYELGELSNATTQLGYAAKLISQKQVHIIARLFPEPLAGWTSRKAEGQSTGVGLAMNMGVMSERQYQNGNNEILTITIHQNSPMIQAIKPILTNSSIVAKRLGRSITVNDQQAFIQDKNGTKKLTLLDESKLLIIETKGEEVLEAEMMQYARAIDLNQIK